MSKIKALVKTWRWYIVAYVVFFVVIWFVASPKMTAATAYFGVIGLHVVFAFLAWIVRKIVRG